MSISTSICLCQPLSFSCISSTIFHYFSVFSPSFPSVSLSLSALIEAAAARRVRRYLIRRLNQRCGPMANPSANKKEGETITSALGSPPCPSPASPLISFSIPERFASRRIHHRRRRPSKHSWDPQSHQSGGAKHQRTERLFKAAFFRMAAVCKVWVSAWRHRK